MRLGGPSPTQDGAPAPVFGRRGVRERRAEHEDGSDKDAERDLREDGSLPLSSVCRLVAGLTWKEKRMTDAATERRMLRLVEKHLRRLSACCMTSAARPTEKTRSVRDV